MPQKSFSPGDSLTIEGKKYFLDESTAVFINGVIEFKKKFGEWDRSLLNIIYLLDESGERQPVIMSDVEAALDAMQ